MAIALLCMKRSCLKRHGLIVLALVAGCLSWSVDRVRAQPADANYNEAKVPRYELPDPLVFQDGSRVERAEDWSRRRAEILELFRTHVYGRAPGRPVAQRFEVFEQSADSLDGKAVRRQVRIVLGEGDASAAFDLLIYLPKSAPRPVPAFLVLNFYGNHAMHADPGIRLCEAWLRNNPDNGIEDNRATERSRGVSGPSYPVEAILARGYAFATVCYCDIDPDFDDGFRNGVHAVGYGPEPLPPAGERWGSIAGWAWGASRALDYLETDPDVDATRVAVMGHSRLGKTALWAGAADSRFALAISNNSGCGGAALSRRRFGETVARINKSFPHWFNDNFNRYSGNEDALPVDQHMLVALLAPRPVYVASATQDRWADPRGEFLSCVHATPVYRLLGLQGLEAAEMPEPDAPIQAGRIGYHLRTGTHGVQDFDWQAYLDFADKHLGKAE